MDLNCTHDMMVKDAASVVIASSSVSAFVFLLIYKNLVHQPDNNTCEGNTMAFVFFAFIPFFVFVDGSNAVPVEKNLYAGILGIVFVVMSLFLLIILNKKKEFESHFWKKLVSVLTFLVMWIVIAVYVYQLEKSELLTFFNYILLCTIIVLLLCAYKRKILELSIYLSIFMFFTIFFSMLVEHLFHSSCTDIQTKQIIFAIITIVIIIVVALFKTQSGENMNFKYNKMKAENEVELKTKLKG